MAIRQQVEKGDAGEGVMDLAAATALTAVAPGVWEARLNSSYEALGPSGGLLAAIALRAAGEVAQLPLPMGTHCSFVARPSADKALRVTARVIRESKRSEAIAVELRQQDEVILRSEVRTRATMPGIEHHFGAHASVPGPDELRTMEDLTGADTLLPPLINRFEQRPTIWSDDWPPPAPPDPVVRTWCRFRPVDRYENPFVDATRALVLVDVFAWVAAGMPHVDGLRYRGVSTDLTVTFHEPLAESWLLVETVSPVASGGVVNTTSRVWDGAHRLVASGLSNLVCVGAG